MGAGQTTIIGSSVNSDDYRYQMDITHQGAVPISGIVFTDGERTEGNLSKVNVVDINGNELLLDMLNEMKILNLNMNILTDNYFKPEDVDNT